MLYVTLSSKVVARFSYNYLHYSINDDNNFFGLSYYRLRLVDYAGNITYSNTVAAGGIPGGNQILVWPNPAPGRFFVSISSAAAIKTIVL